MHSMNIQKNSTKVSRVSDCRQTPTIPSLLQFFYFKQCDFRSMALAFRGVGGEPPWRCRLWGLTCPTTPAGVECHSATIEL